MNIATDNPSVKALEKTFLGKAYAAGISSILVKNTDRFVDGAKILIGEMSRERSEIAEIDGNPTATSIALAATTDFPHDADDPVYLLEWDQVRIYRSTTGENGTYSLLATVDVDVDNRDGKTYYEDENALTTYYYKTAFYDSVNDEESDRSGAIAATGYSELQVGTILTEVARQVGDPDFIEMDVETYLSHLNDINADLITQAKRPYRFLKAVQAYDVDADDSTLAFPADFWKVNYVEAKEIGNSIVTREFRPKVVSATKARYELAAFPNGGQYVRGIAFDDENDQILFYPKAQVERLGAFTLYYYKKFTRITSLSDIVETPNTLIYKLGLKREFYNMKADSDDKYLKKAMDYDKRYNTEVMKLQREKSITADSPGSMGADRKNYPQWGGRRYRQ